MKPIKRICFECDHRYVGDERCPKCGYFSGEPIPAKKNPRKL